MKLNLQLRTRKDIAKVQYILFIQALKRVWSDKAYKKYAKLQDDFAFAYNNVYGETSKRLIDINAVFEYKNNIYIITNRPGIIIGKAGCNIDALSAALEKNVYIIESTYHKYSVQDNIYSKRMF